MQYIRYLRKYYNNEAELEFNVQIPLLAKCVGCVIMGTNELLRHLISEDAYVGIFINDRQIHQLQ
jgi:hypothetical protein